MPRFRSPGLSDYILASVLVAAAVFAGWLAFVSFRGAQPSTPFHVDAVLALALAVGCLFFAWAFVHRQEHDILGSPALSYILVVAGTMMVALGIREFLDGAAPTRAVAGILTGFIGYFQAWQSHRLSRRSEDSRQAESQQS